MTKFTIKIPEGYITFTECGTTTLLNGREAPVYVVSRCWYKNSAQVLHTAPIELFVEVSETNVPATLGGR